ncbi:MAG: acyl-CoA thioesterase domain-containing protein [Pseudomonas caspiana]
MGSEATVQHLNTASETWDGVDVTPLLDVQEIGPDRFTCNCFHTNQNAAIYGGQTLGLAVAAATATVDAHLHPHVLQVSFLAAGDVNAPLSIEVERLQQTRRFAARLVRLVQHGRSIAIATLSFHAGENGMEHQQQCEAAPDPESLMGLAQVREAFHQRLNPIERVFIGKTRSVDIRPADPEQFVLGRNDQASVRYWMRPTRSPNLPARLQPAVLAYLSDFWFGITALMPHREHKLGDDLFVSSLNHTIWFHQQDVQADEWLLVSAHSPSTSLGRGLTLGHVHDQNGRLVATLGQEGLYRLR